jgi:hypothetical protein
MYGFDVCAPQLQVQTAEDADGIKSFRHDSFEHVTIPKGVVPAPVTFWLAKVPVSFNNPFLAFLSFTMRALNLESILLQPQLMRLVLLPVS